MKRATFACLLSAVIVPVLCSAQSGQTSRSKLLDVVVFGAFLTVDMSAYPSDVRSLLQQHLERSEKYRPRRPRPKDADRPVMGMVYDARESYERRLVAAGSGPGVERLAQQYVDELRPCYEWEGFHDCPEREARFAEAYRSRNPNSPFSEFLPLLVAHRWLCAADGYEYEEQPKEAARSRLASEAPLAAALKSQSLLIRTAAQELKARGRCLGPREP